MRIASKALSHYSRCIIPVLLLALLAGPWSWAVAEEARSIPAGQRQLFLDDEGVEESENLRRTLHASEKKGAVIRSANPAQTIQTRMAPVWDPEAQHFKLWVISTDEPLRISTDGLNWTSGPKPNLRIEHAVYDPLDPDPARRFKASLLNEGFAVSPDGVEWTKLDVPAVPSSDEGNISYDPQEGPFIHSVKRGGPFGRSIAIATSRDFKTWSDFGVVFHADELDQELGTGNIKARAADATLQQTVYNVPQSENVDVYNMGVFHYVNVAAVPGDVSVTVLDGNDQTIAVSEPVTGDQPRAELRWKSGNTDTLKEQAVRLRFTLRNSRLYSFWCE